MKRLELALAAVLAFSLTACQPFIPAAQHAGVAPESGEAAPVKVALGGFAPRISTSTYGVQAVPSHTIKRARLEVVGPGFTPMTSDIFALGANAEGSYPIRVSMGPNRIFTATGLDANDKPVPGAVIMAVQTITPGTNTVNLTWQTTPTGGIFGELLKHDGANPGSKLAETISVASVQQFVDKQILWNLRPLAHPSLVDALPIAQYIIANGKAPTSPSSSYIKSTATVNVLVRGLTSGTKFDAWVDDPASGIKQEVAQDVTQTFANVLEGTWRLHILTKDDLYVVETVTVAPGQTLDVRIDFAGDTTANIDFSLDGLPIPPDVFGKTPQASGSDYVRFP